MKIRVHVADSLHEAVSATATLVTTDAVKAEIDGFDPGHLSAAGFKGKADQFYSQPSGDHTSALVGVGSAKSLDGSVLRRAGALAARSLKRHSRIAVRLPEVAVSSEDGGQPEVLPAQFQAVAEGAILGSYGFTAYKSGGGGSGGSKSAESDDQRLSHLDLITDASGSAREGIEDAVQRARDIAGAVCLARDLVNEPGGSLTAPVFAARAAEIAADTGLECTIWKTEDIKRERLGGLLGVNRGSIQPPRFVQLAYEPEDAQATLAFVGKGLTFDAGGLSIKTAQGMMTMKMDMGGAAAVLAAMSALRAVAAPVRVLGFLPMTDNMLGGDATRPGDVLRIRNGKTIEVLNTDAEGRLVLADALSLACEAEPDAIVDLATLTGACMVALGRRIAGLMGNDDQLVESVKAAAASSGERVWHLPLPDDYEKQIKSSVADMKNIGDRYGGALTAALILQKFVADGVRWAHLDIAGPAFAESQDGETPKGATGFGVRTLVQLALDWENSN